MSIASRVKQIRKKIRAPKVKYPSFSEFYTGTDWETWMRKNNPPSDALELAIAQTKHLSDMY